MSAYIPLKTSRHAPVLPNGPLMHSNRTCFEDRSSVPLTIKLYNKNTSTPQTDSAAYVKGIAQ